jgi:hypothetical protein
MKKSSALLLLLCCGVLVGALAIGITTLLRQFRPHPPIQCEAMRPLIAFNGISYLNPSQAELAHAPSASQLGQVVGTAGNGPQHVQYDCNLLNPGEQVYSIKGYQASFRLAVRTSNGVFFYDVGENPRARTGADLFDLAGKVQSLAIAPIDNPDSPTKTIRDPATIEKLVGEILAAPVISNCSSGGNEEALLFHMKDGSLVELRYWPAGQRLETRWPQCVQLPPDFANRL